MELWTVIAIGAFGAAAVAAVIWRRRAVNAEATVRSIGLLVDQSGSGAQLVSAVRSSVISASDAGSQAGVYLAALNGASIGIALADATGEIRYSNPAAEVLLFGDDEKSVLVPRVSALVKRVQGRQIAEQIESDIHDPTRRVLTTTAVPLPVDDASGGSVAIYVEDLSAQKRVDAMRTDFVANASHELKTPLGALSILAETLAETEDEDARERLAGRLRDEAARMANVVDDVVRLAETESLGVEFEPVDIEQLVEAAVASVATLADERRIRLERGPMVSGLILASSEQVTSAIRNLLENAIAYTAVKKEPGTVRYGVRRENESLCVDVADTGVGIPDRYRERVFERFFRVDRARSRESGGTGLGLSIVRNVALAHGGTVDLTSEVGRGSTFTICIPESKEART